MPAHTCLHQLRVDAILASPLWLVPLLLIGCKGETSTTVGSGGTDDSSRFALDGIAWVDLDCDGVRQEEEPGLANVILQLVRAEDQALIGAAITADDGAWSIVDIPEGTYELSVRGQPDGYLPTSCDGSPPDSSQECPVIEVTTTGTYDFGFSLYDAELGDRVWLDEDCDGIQGPDEPGIPDVPVRLLREGVVVDSTTTDDLGSYQFFGLCGGPYVIEVDTPLGLVPTLEGVGNDEEVDSEQSPAPVELASGDVESSDDSIDFGFCGSSGSIGDFVWRDLDCDGIQDPGEPGLRNVTICLFHETGEVDFATTQEDGSYSFGNLLPKTYWVEVDLTTVHPSLTETLCNQGEDPTKDSDCGLVEIELGEGQVDDSIDFGFKRECCGDDLALGDFIWNDLDCDGIQDAGEPGLENVVVYLEKWGLPYDEQKTDEDGYYLFRHLCPGEYVVRVEPASLPPDLLPTECDQGENDDLDSECSPVEVMLDEGADISIDFGYRSPCCGHASIGDLIWDDLNCNGVQDVDEPGLEGVRLRLHDLDGTAYGVAESDETGHYWFENLCKGTYRVTVVEESVKAGYEPTECNVGDDTLDNDCSPVVVELTSDDQVDDTVDFGFRSTCCDGRGRIGDLVWNDLDCDGVQDAGESGLAHVLVRLYSATGEQLFETVTGSRGEYAFEGLCAGSYLVEIDPATLPAGFVPSPCGATDPEFDSNCDTLVTLPTDRSIDDTIDFGFHDPCCHGTGSIGDRVWNDRNCSGWQDPGEPGLANVVLELFKDGVSYGTTETDAHGAYSFENLCAGTYVIELVSGLPPDFVATDCANTPNDPGDSNCLPATVVLADDGTRDDTIDFGFHGCCGGISGIGDRTWFDADGDGCFDEDEEGIGGIVVRVYDENGTLVSEQTTPDYGRWKVFGLCAGTYTVEAWAPPELNLAPTICEACGDPDTDSNCQPATVVLGADEVDFSIDFGFVEIAGSEGCSPGYWKQQQHFDSWPAPYYPEMPFDLVFEDALPGKTLLAALQQRSDDSPLSSLARQAVAAALNAQAPAVEFGMTAAQVASLFDAVFPGGDAEYEQLKDYLEGLNTRHCPLD